VSTVQTLAAYLDDEITAMPNLVTTAATTVGALDSGSITSGFGAIDNGASNITNGGLVHLDVDADADDLTGDSATGRLTIGAGQDLNLYHGGTNSYIVNDTGDLIIDTVGDIILDCDGDNITLKAAGTIFGGFSKTGSGEMIIASGSSPTTALTFSGANVTAAGTITGNLTGNVTGNASGTALTVTQAAQSAITSVGTLTALTVDDVAVDGKVITMTGSSGDTFVTTVAANGATSLVTTDAAAAAAHLTITADGTVDINSAGILTLDSGAAINIEPAAGSAILLDGTISIDAGVVTGATSITSTAFVGGLTGNVTGNASGTALTVTQAAQTAITSLGTLTGDLNFGDSVKARFGAGQDLQIWHDGSNSYIKDHDTGVLFIQSSGTTIEDTGGNDMAIFNDGGSVDLFHNAVKKFETIAGGVRIPDGGLLFGSDTATANALDDYEEGTWTPSITVGTGLSIGTVHQNRYTKIGRTVTLNASFNIDSSSSQSASGVRIGGIPYAMSNFSNGGFPLDVHYNYKVTPCAFIASNFYIYYQNTTVGGNNQEPFGTALDTSNVVSFTFSYVTV